MLHIYIFFILIISSKCRMYEGITIIQETILAKIQKLNLSTTINGTNGLLYKLAKKYIYFSYNDNKFDQINYISEIYNPIISILFNLSIHEYTNNIFDLNYFNNAFLTDKLITVNIDLNLLKLYKISEDFSFDVSYEIENITNNITIHFDDLIESDSFKYLFYEEKSFLYDNKTLNEYIKYTILNSLINKTKHMLIEYPEIDSLEYFKRLIDYTFFRSFYVVHYCENIQKLINYASVTGYNFNQIIKNDTHILLRDVKFDLKLSYLSDMDIEYYDEGEYNVKLKINELVISRDKNYTISYGKADDDCNLVILSEIIKITMNKIRI